MSPAELSAFKARLLEPGMEHVESLREYDDVMRLIATIEAATETLAKLRPAAARALRFIRSMTDGIEVGVAMILDEALGPFADFAPAKLTDKRCPVCRGSLAANVRRERGGCPHCGRAR